MCQLLENNDEDRLVTIFLVEPLDPWNTSGAASSSLQQFYYYHECECPKHYLTLGRLEPRPNIYHCHSYSCFVFIKYIHLYDIYSIH